MASLSDKVAIQYSSRVLVPGRHILGGIFLVGWLLATNMVAFGQMFRITYGADRA